MRNIEKINNIQAAMKDLRSCGIHSIVVKSNDEARNFILYHVQVGTEMYLEDSKELRNINLKRRVVERGGNIIILDDKFIENEEYNDKVGIQEVFVCSCDILIKEKKIKLDKIMERMDSSKIILIDENGKEIINFINKVKELREKQPTNDISVVFIA